MSAVPSRIRGAEPSDLVVVVDLLNACDAAEIGGPDTTTQDIEGDWVLNGFELSRDAWVALAADGRLVGYAYTGDQLRTGDLEADFWVHPGQDEPGLAGRLLSLVERRADELARVRGYHHDATLSIFCITVNDAKRELLRQRGFQLVRTVYRMAADLETAAALGPLPEGIAIRAFRLDEDERAMHAAMRETFADDLRRSDEPFDAWKARLMGHSDFDPGLWFLAWDGDQAAGGLVAYDHGDLGWIKGLGVRRPWRCRGIGSALLAHAFAELARRGQRRVELGVDAEGATQPLRVYERAGMHVAFAYESYTVRLGGPGYHRRDEMTAPSDKNDAREIRLARPGLDAEVTVPGSKSITNRALLLAALARGESTLTGALAADDTHAFATALRNLGFSVDKGAEGWRVQGAAGRIPAQEADVYCAEAGTAARFLLAACAAGEGRYRLDAAPQLRRRPLGLLLEALRTQGVRTEPATADQLPLTLEARGLSGGPVRLPGDTSSQFISALLMAAPLARAPLTMEVDGLVSRPYVDMTLAMMKQFGVASERDAHRLFRVSPATYVARTYAVEPDASTASYFYAAAAVSSGRVKVAGLHRESSLQGDIRFVDVLAAMGCTVTDEPDGLVVAGPATLAGLTVDMGDISDTFMTLAAIAPFADSPVTITGIANVRLKESDRIAAMATNLARLGIVTESGPDFLRIHPGRPTAGHIDPASDHRIAMSFAVLGLRAAGIVIDDPGCVSKTCPTFFALWATLEHETETIGQERG